MKPYIILFSLVLLVTIPAYADFHSEMVQFMPNSNFFDESWDVTEIQGFEDLEIEFSEFAPDGLIQRFVFNGQNNGEMVTTISVYDFVNSQTASDTFVNYVSELSQKEYENGPLEENLQNNCYSAMINHDKSDEKTSIVCKNLQYIIISTSEQSNFVFYNNVQFTTTIAANGFTNEVYQNIEESKTKIPSWIKNNAGWWADGITTDQTFIDALQFLIDKKIISITNTSEVQKTIETPSIPEWVKNNAKWWSKDKIDDETFIEGIQFLFKEGILK